jgi:beta-lactamase regulating signal transducer with metallopeptidase domain
MILLASIQSIAERVLNSIPEGLLIAVFAWLLLRLMGRQNSGTRFAVWFATLLAIAALPFVPAVRGSVARAVHAEVTLPGSWALVIFGAWATIALVASARLVLGLWRLRSLRRNARPLSDVDSVLRDTIEQCQAIRQVDVCASAEVRVPTAIGFFQPVILIPEWAAAELSGEELRAIVLHEFAHLRRWDDWTNLLQKFVRAIFFFHPAILWIERRLSLEREMACDDAVVAETANPHAYARCLVSLAERSLVRRGIAMAQAAISRAKDTSLRLAQILDIDRPNATRVFSPAVVAVMAFAGLCFLAVPNAPRLIAFGAPSADVPEVSASAHVASEPMVPKSMVIPAAAHVLESAPQLKLTTSSRASSHSQPLKSAKRKVNHSVKAPREVLAKYNSAPQSPLVVQAKATQVESPAPQYLVLTQSTQYVRQGSAVMTYSVWRLTLVTVKNTASKPPNQT